MSLDWDITKCPNPTEWYHSVDQWGFTQSVIFACIPVGIGKITKLNVDKFTLRWNMWNRMMSYDTELITRDQMEPYVGLHTNVFPEMSDSAFAKNCMRVLRDDVYHDMKLRAKEKAKEAKEAGE